MRLALVLILLLSALSVAALPDEGIVYYGASNISQFKHWNGSGAESAQTTKNGQADVYWIRSAASPIREEQIQVELRSDGSLHAHVYRESLFASQTLTTSFGSIAPRYRGFDVVYDRNGNAIIVHANDTDTAVYDVWNGTHFIGGGSLLVNDSCRGIPRWIELAASPVADTVLMAELDTTASHCSQTWNGSAWTAPHFFVDTDLLSSIGPRMDLAFEQSGQALVVFESDALGAPRYATWNNGWSSPSSLSYTTDVMSWVVLTPHPSSDTIAFTSYAPTNSTARVKVWNGTHWSSTSTIEGMAPGVQRPIDLAYLDTTLYLAYQSNTSQTKYATCTNHCSSGSWSSSTLPFAANTRYIQLASSTLTDELILGLTDSTTQRLLHFDSSWGAYQSIDSNSVLNSVEEMSIVYDAFNDTTPPEVTNPQPSPGSNESSGSTVTISADVDDFGVVDVVRAYVTSPSNITSIYSMSNTSNVRYQVTILPSTQGIYNVRFVANDTRGNTNLTTTTYFNYTYTGPRVTILAPVGSSFSNGTQLTLRGNATESGTPISPGNLTWFSDLDGTLGNGENLTVSLSSGVHTITLRARDSLGITANATKLIELFADRDQDGLADNPDTLEGDESWVTTTGVDVLDVSVNNNTNISNKGYVGLGNLTFSDANFTLLEFTHNFSITEIDLSNFSFFIDATTFRLDAPDVQQTPKTIYMSDSSFQTLCVRTDGLPASTTCSGTNETEITACLGRVNVTTINGISCQDLGDTIVISNLTGVSVTATTPTSNNDDDRGSSSGSGNFRPSRGSSSGTPSSTSNNPAPSPNSDSGPKTTTQTVNPVAPERAPEKPTPIVSKKKRSLWWLWALLIIGILLTAVSFMNRDRPLKEARHRDSFFK